MTDSKFSAPLGGREVFVDRPDGTRIRTVVLGSGERTALLAHGYGFTADEWNIVGPALAEQGFRVIAFDQRGHGKSTIGSDGVGSAQMASDYGAILASHDVRDAVLVGHSMGGFLATKFLLDGSSDDRERVAACLLVATFAGDVNRRNAQNRVQIPLIKSGVLLWMLGIGFIARPFVRSLVGTPFDPNMVDAVVGTFRSQDHARLVPILEAFVNESNYARLSQITVPCTIVVGAKDRTTPPFHTEDLHAGIAGSNLVTLPDKGHLLNWEAPDAIVGQIVELARA